MDDLFHPNPWLVGLPALLFGCLVWAVVCAVRWRELVGWPQLVRALLWVSLCWAAMTLALSWFSATVIKPPSRHVTDWVSLTAVAFSILAATGFEAVVSTHGLRAAVPQAFRESLVGKRTRQLVAVGLLLTLLIFGGLYVAFEAGMTEFAPSVAPWIYGLINCGLVCVFFGLFAGWTRALRTNPRSPLPYLGISLGMAAVAGLFLVAYWALSVRVDLLEMLQRDVSTVRHLERDAPEDERVAQAEQAQNLARVLFLLTGEPQEYRDENGVVVPFVPSVEDQWTQEGHAAGERTVEKQPRIAALVAALGMLAGLLFPRRVNRISRSIGHASRHTTSEIGTA